MGRFVSSETKVIRADWWDEGEEVTIRKLNYGQRKTIQSAAQKVIPDGDGTWRVVTDVAAMDLAILEQGIVSWTFAREADGRRRAVPVSERFIKMLHERDAEFIVNAIHAYNPRRPEEAQAGF